MLPKPLTRSSHQLPAASDKVRGGLDGVFKKISFVFEHTFLEGLKKWGRGPFEMAGGYLRSGRILGHFVGFAGNSRRKSGLVSTLHRRRWVVWTGGGLGAVVLGLGLAVFALNPDEVVVLQGEPGKPGAGPDASQFYSAEELDAKVAATPAYVTGEKFAQRYATKDVVPDLGDVVTAAAFAQATAGYLTKVDLDQGYVKAGGVPTLQGYLTASAAAQKYATTSEIPSQDDLVYEEDLVPLQDVMSKEVFSAIYVTNSQLASYLTKTEADAAFVDPSKPLPGVFASAVADVVAQELATPKCEDDEVRIQSLCIDKFEATVWNVPCDQIGVAADAVVYGTTKDDYGDTFPDTGNWTEKRYACSVTGYKPSASITYFQAQQACALSGKRLCSNAEWQMAAMGTDLNNCAYNSGQSLAIKASSACKSEVGAYDLVGNVSEWTADWIQAGEKQSKALEPNKQESGTQLVAVWKSGPVGDTDDCIRNANGTASGKANALAGIVRGGATGQLPVVGRNAVDVTIAPSQSDASVGFRCCRRL